MKGKILSFFFFWSSFYLAIHAQDILTKRNGDEMQVKVTDITLDEVKYKRFTNLTGPTFVIDKSEIFMIKYENGDKDLFEEDPATDMISIRHIAGQVPAIVQAPPVVQVAPEKETKKSSSAAPTSQQTAPKTSQKPTDPKEQFNQALAYENGDGVTKDLQKAADLYLEAAEQGYRDAQYSLGILYSGHPDLRIKLKEDYTMRNGGLISPEGFPLADGTAIYWFRKAAELGHPHAKEKAQQLEAKYKPVSQPSTSSDKPTTEQVKPVSGKYYASSVQVWNKTYTISIGLIDKNEKGETRIELLIPEFGEALPPQGYPVIACMIIGNDTIQPNHLNMGRDTKNMQFAYSDNSRLPEKILILGYKNDSYVPCMLFDGKTKEILGSNDMPIETEAPTPVFDASKGEHDLVDLIENKIVEVKIKGNDITNVTVSLHRLVSYPVKVKVPVGSFFVSANTSKQNMVGTAEKKITLNTDNWTNLSVPAACANRPKGIPDSDDSFSVTRSPHQAELTKLMPELAKAGANTLTKQAAVWIITDDASYVDLGILQRNGYARAIGAVETARAMQICSQAGINLQSKRIWKDKDYILENLSDGALKNWLKEQK